MDKYAVEKRIALLIFLKNLFLIAAAAASTLGLYAMSHSWHSLWPMGLCLLQSKIVFMRDDETDASTTHATTARSSLNVRNKA